MFMSFVCFSNCKKGFELLLKLGFYYTSEIDELAVCIKQPVILEDEAHVPHESLHPLVSLLNQPVLDFV